jgi:hypothetical protein
MMGLGQAGDTVTLPRALLSITKCNRYATIMAIARCMISR